MIEKVDAEAFARLEFKDNWTEARLNAHQDRSKWNDSERGKPQRWIIKSKKQRLNDYTLTCLDEEVAWTGGFWIDATPNNLKTAEPFDKVHDAITNAIDLTRKWGQPCWWSPIELNLEKEKK